MNKGFNGLLTSTHKIFDKVDKGENGYIFGGANSGKTNIGLASKSKASINPTSDEDDISNPRAKGLKKDYGFSSKGGASGDGRTPGYDGSGSGVGSLDGAHGNKSDRNLAK